MQQLFLATESIPATDTTDAKLLALGVIFEDASATCYLATHEAHSGPREIDARPSANVIPLPRRVDGIRATDLVALGRQLGRFIADIGEPVALCYDDKTDWQLMESALKAASCWKELAPVLHARNIRAEIADDGAVDADSHTSPRLAMDRAKALRERWLCRPSTDTTPFGVVRAFLGYHGLDRHGSSLYTLLSQSDPWMAQHTSFIQWILPVAERSMFRQRGPLLSLAEFGRLSLDQRVRAGVALSRDRLLRYLGLDFAEGQLSKRANWSEAEAWSRIASADDLRVSRLLRSLVLFGFVEESRTLYRGLEALIREARGVDVAELTLAYWRAAAFKANGQP